MAVKLYNASPLSDAALRPLLTAAQHLAGAKGDVVVHVGRGSSRGLCHGTAYSCVWVRMEGRKVNTDGGYFTICPPLYGDPLICAVQFLKVAIHEFAHIRDYQHDPWKNRLQWATRTANGRRERHDNRPEEVRAQNAVADALQILKHDVKRRARIDELVLAVGIEIEAALQREGPEGGK